MFIPEDKVEKITTYSDNLYREIAIRTGCLMYYDHVLDMGADNANMKNLLKHNLIYDADMDVADRYIKYFNEEFDPDPNYKLYKTYMDIEVDLMSSGWVKNKDGSVGYIGFPDEELAPCPVNIISLIDAKLNNTYVFVCRNNLNKSEQDFETKVENYKDEVKNRIAELHGFYINEFFVSFYNSEEETIEAFFKIIHQIDPDICLSWNQSFDIITLMNRLKKLYAKKPEYKQAGAYNTMLSTVCDQKYLFMTDESSGKSYYLSPKAYYRTNKNTNIVDRFDTFTVLDGIVYLDQMLLYANVRKGAMKDSYSLDAIANEELGKEKLDYTGYTIKNLPWKNFPKFFEYNIMDVVLLKLLEDKNLDVDMLQRLSDITNTRKEKVFKKTISLKNFVEKFAELQGYIISNNKNAKYGNETEYFENTFLNKTPITEADPAYLNLFNKRENFGAYVGDPNLNDYEGIKVIGNKKSMFIFENVFDEDFSSLYPSIIQAFNLDSNSEVGKFFLIDDHIKNKLLNEYDYDGLFSVSKNEEGLADGEVSSDDLGPTLVDSLESHNWSRIGEKFFDLPTTTEIINELKNLREKKE